MSIFDRIIAADRSAFLAINGAHTPHMDTLMWYVSEPITWIPLYLLLLLLLKFRWGWRGLMWSLPVIAIMILCSDSGSVMLFKNTVHRLRPCHAADLQGMVHLVRDYCGGDYGFVSAHASNHFAIAAFMIGMLQRKPWWALVLLFAWAALISYSRIYLGVHYPGDVIVGAIFGAAVGMLACLTFITIHQRTSAA